MARPSIKTMPCMLVYQKYEEDGTLEKKKRQLKREDGNPIFNNSDEAKEGFANLEMKDDAKIQCWLLAEEVVARSVVKVQTVFEDYKEPVIVPKEEEKPKDVITEDEEEIDPISDEDDEPNLVEPEITEDDDGMEM